MSELVVAYAATKVIDHFVDRFAESVIQRWSRYRARRFVGALVTGIAAGRIDEAEALKRVDAALADEAKSAALFDAYRRVCLAASRDAGPRLVGLMTARLLSENRLATDVEERLLMAAEILSDAEFGSFLGFLREADGVPHRSGSTIYIENHSESEYTTDPGMGVDVAPLNLGDSHGTWALKLASVGMLTQRIEQKRRRYEPGSIRGVADGGAATTYTWSVGIAADFLDYIELIDLACRAEE